MTSEAVTSAHDSKCYFQCRPTVLLLQSRGCRREPENRAKCRLGTPSSNGEETANSLRTEIIRLF